MNHNCCGTPSPLTWCLLPKVVSQSALLFGKAKSLEKSKLYTIVETKSYVAQVHHRLYPECT